ncbi:hypothetical protein E0H73_08630 [Kribbella pittospori]|uniref:Immunity protein Imm1 n=1 Tax=Kribbella pittospori TaxID=722689 RepID=A0A4R0KU16_9ACTN|nr:Imm1 family immunity protein [Kribbella pittospori]TCC64451.1 hypothetical protein E0H73_08630 [Kribbella pittospori]
MTYTAKAYYLPEHEDEPIEIDGTDDLRALIDAMLSQPRQTSVVVLYINERPLHEIGVPDHELKIGVLADRKLGSARFVNGRDAVYASGHSDGVGPIRYQYMGHEDLFPADSLAELDTLLGVANSFLEVGGSERPRGVEWLEWPKRQ